MGPAATAHFQTRLVELTDAAADADHPVVVTWSDPTVPNRVAALQGRGPSPVPALRHGLGVLAGAGAQVLAVACNTVHPFLPEALAGFDLQLVDMIEVAAEETAAAGISTAAVLATAATLEHGMYARALDSRSVVAHTPQEGTQAAVLELIAAVKAGVPVRGLVSGYVLGALRRGSGLSRGGGAVAGAGGGLGGHARPRHTPGCRFHPTAVTVVTDCRTSLNRTR